MMIDCASALTASFFVLQFDKQQSGTLFIITDLVQNLMGQVLPYILPHFVSAQ